MEIEMRGSKTIEELQAEFMKVYPYIKPVFFTQPHKVYRPSNVKFLINDRSRTIGEIREKKFDNEGWLYIEDEMPVWQLERLFESEFGLHVQIFRKSGSRWLETTITDDLDLAAQNAKGEASEKYIMPIGEPMDYREMD